MEFSLSLCGPYTFMFWVRVSGLLRTQLVLGTLLGALSALEALCDYALYKSTFLLTLLTLLLLT